MAHKFKVGNRVIVKDGDGVVRRITTYADRDSIFPYNLEGLKASYSDDELEPYKKDWDTLEVGDVILPPKRGGSVQYRVLGSLEEVAFVVSDRRKANETGGSPIAIWKEQWKLLGWTVKGAEEDEVTELTLDDIAEKYGIPVELLKIKK